MTLALRYILLGFLCAGILQVFAAPPTWALFAAFTTGMVFGAAFTAAQLWACDVLEKRDL